MRSIWKFVGEQAEGVPKEHMFLQGNQCQLDHFIKLQLSQMRGHTSLLPPAEQATYASIYASFAAYQEAEQIEQRSWADLRTLEQRPVVSPVVDWQLRSAIQQA